MARTKKTAVAAEEATKENIEEIVGLDEVPTKIAGDDEPIIKMGKREQKPGLLCNPKSKHFNAKVAKRRAKEKARRKAARKNRK